MSSGVPSRPQGSVGRGLGDGLVAERLVLARRVDPAGLDDVDVDAVRQQLGGDGQGHVVQARLGRVVGDAAGRTGSRAWTLEMNTILPPPPALHHVPRDELAHVEPAGQRPLHHACSNVSGS